MLELSSPLKTAPLRLSLVGRASSQKKKRKSTSISGPSSLDEENNHNQRAKSPRTSTLSKEKKAMTETLPTINTDIDTRKLSGFQSNLSPNLSEAGTEISSVSERREWLKNFEKKQASNAFRAIEKERPRVSDDRNNHETKTFDFEGREPPPQPPKPIQVSSAKKPRKPRPVINRRASSTQMPSWVIGANQKDEVKATDESCASVASLSKWLANDPTSAKKKRHVRRGRNIISQSRQFEPDSENVIVMEAKISRGAVGDKKKWLQKAFQSTIEEDEDETLSTYSGYVRSDVGRPTGSYPRFNRQGAQTEIITDDAASSLSVADKKDWLKKAFVTNSEERKKTGYTRAQTDVMHNRREPSDGAASRAKLRFKERSARKLMEATSTRPSGKPAPTAISNNTVESTGRDEIFRTENIVVEEDTTPVDFRAARNALVERSKKNGHNAQVINKVFLRKKKFEKLEEDSRRKSLSVGLVLKPSWEVAEPTKGRPSGVYEKTFVPAHDIAPKKSFEELP